MLNFTLGPVSSSDDVLKIASHQTPYFRTNEFSSVMFENENLMLEFLSAPMNSRCIFLTASGTGAMEAVVMNVLNARDKVIVINGGGYGFGQRFVDLCKLHKRNFSEIKLPFGHKLSETKLIPYINKGYTALLVNMCETSSGVLYDMPFIAQFCKENNILLIVDAISSFIADEVNMEKLNIATVIIGSQKALAVQPGIALVVLSPEAVKRVNGNPESSMYFSLNHALKLGEYGQTPFTPAVTTLLQINTRLKYIKNNGGIEAENRKIKKIATEFREGIMNLPLEIFSQSKSNALTALKLRNSNAQDIIHVLKEEYNIWICSMGGEMREKGIRIGHLGNVTTEDNQKLINALYSLNERGLL